MIHMSRALESSDDDDDDDEGHDEQPAQIAKRIATEKAAAAKSSAVGKDRDGRVGDGADVGHVAAPRGSTGGGVRSGAGSGIVGLGGGNKRVVKAAPAPVATVSKKPVQAVAGPKSGNKKKRVREESDSDGDSASGSGSEGDSGSDGEVQQVERPDVENFRGRLYAEAYGRAQKQSRS
jgi:hypothetical protein